MLFFFLWKKNVGPSLRKNKIGSLRKGWKGSIWSPARMVLQCPNKRTALRTSSDPTVDVTNIGTKLMTPHKNEASVKTTIKYFGRKLETNYLNAKQIASAASSLQTNIVLTTNLWITKHLPGILYQRLYNKHSKRYKRALMRCTKVASTWYSTDHQKYQEEARNKLILKTIKIKKVSRACVWTKVLQAQNCQPFPPIRSSGCPNTGKQFRKPFHNRMPERESPLRSDCYY